MIDEPEFKYRDIHWHYGVILGGNGYHAYVRKHFNELFIEEHGISPPMVLPVESLLLETKWVTRWIDVKNSLIERLLTGQKYKRIKTHDRLERWAYWSKGDVRIMVTPEFTVKDIES